MSLKIAKILSVISLQSHGTFAVGIDTPAVVVQLPAEVKNIQFENWSSFSSSEDRALP
jgi:hypothetical protein